MKKQQCHNLQFSISLHNKIIVGCTTVNIVYSDAWFLKLIHNQIVYMSGNSKGTIVMIAKCGLYFMCTKIKLVKENNRKRERESDCSGMVWIRECLWNVKCVSHETVYKNRIMSSEQPSQNQPHGMEKSI